MAVLQGEAARQAMARARRRARLASAATTSTGPRSPAGEDVLVPLPATETTRRADIIRRTADRLLAG